MEISRAWADDSNDVYHLRICHLLKVMGGGWVIELCDCRVSSFALLREGLKKRKNVDLSTYASDPSTHPPNVDKNK